MMKMKFVKRLLAVLLLAVMLVPAAAFAEAAETVNEKEWWNILLLGGDSRSIENFERTDTMIILSVNREAGELKMTSIMRDTWVELTSGKKGKINAANVYGGPELAVEVVNKCFGTDIEDYVLINMNGLVELLDMLGGVDLEISESERKYANDYAKHYIAKVADYEGQTVLEQSGQVHLNGLLAVAFLRNRYSDSDYGRVMRQQEVLLAAAEQAQNMEVDALMQIADDIYDRIATNMTNEELKEIAMAGMVVEPVDVGQFRVPADGAFEDGTFGGTWMIRPDLAKNQKLLHDFIYGEDAK